MQTTVLNFGLFTLANAYGHYSEPVDISKFVRRFSKGKFF